MMVLYILLGPLIPNGLLSGVNNGIILQFGHYPHKQATEDFSRNLTFPITYTTINYYCHPVSIYAGYTQNGYHTISNKTLTGCILWPIETEGNWISIGY